MKGNSSEHPLNHAGQLLSFGLFIVAWISDSFIFHWTTEILDFVPLWLRLSIGVMGFISVIYLFKKVIASFPEEGDSDEVLARGPFKFCRHPMYLACVIFYFALALSTASVLALILIGPIFLFYNHIAAFEEKFLIEKFGVQYCNYMEQTPRWCLKI